MSYIVYNQHILGNAKIILKEACQASRVIVPNAEHPETQPQLSAQNVAHHSCPQPLLPLHLTPPADMKSLRREKKDERRAKNPRRDAETSGDP